MTDIDYMARVRAALAEMGWDGHFDEAMPAHDPTLDYGPTVRLTWYGGVRIPNAILWTAYKLSGIPMACWSCWNAQITSYACALKKECAHPEGPATPPRELLVPGPGNLVYK